MRIFFKTLFIWLLSCGSPKHNTQDTPAYSAAVEARFVDDQNLKINRKTSNYMLEHSSSLLNQESILLFDLFAKEN